MHYKKHVLTLKLKITSSRLSALLEIKKQLYTLMLRAFDENEIYCI